MAMEVTLGMSPLEESRSSEGVEGVGGDERRGVGGGEDGGGEDAAGVIDEFGMGVGGEEVEAVGEALLDLGFDGVVVGPGRSCCGRWRRSGSAG